MSTYTAAELSEIIKNHQKWLDCAEGGERANLNGADLRNTNLRNVNLSGAKLHNADLSGANLNSAWLSNAELGGANLSNASVICANLNGANLSGAWLNGANLNGANLNGANLLNTNLRGTSGNRREIKAMQCDIWAVTYTAKTMQIGCERHKIADWWAFSDHEISLMHGKALAWWGTWKPILQQIIKTSPAAVSQLRKATLAKARGETE